MASSSGYPQSSRALSRALAFSVGGPGPSPRDRMVVVASCWNFLPERVALAKKRLDKELELKRLKGELTWNDGDQTFRFIILVGNTDTIWELLHGVVRNIIKEELDKNRPRYDSSGDDDSDVSDDLDDGEDHDDEKEIKSKLIQRLSIWEKKNGISDATTNEVDHQRNPAVDIPEKIQFYKARDIWECRDKPNFGAIACDANLVELKRLTGCEFATDLNKGKIDIGGHSEERCRLAILKLDNIRKSYSTVPYFNHIFYSEDAENFQVLLKFFTNVKKRYFETTLLDNLEIYYAYDYNNLKDAVTARCAVYDPHKALYTPAKNLKIKRAVNEESKNLSPKYWANFSYCSKGEKSKDPMRHFSESDAPQEHRHADQQMSSPNPTPPAKQVSTVPETEDKPDIQHWRNQLPSPKAQPLLGNAVVEGPVLLSGMGKAQVNKPQASRPAWDSYTEYSAGVKVKQESFPRSASHLKTTLAAIRAAQYARPLNQIGMPRSTSQPVVQLLPAQKAAAQPAVQGQALKTMGPNTQQNSVSSPRPAPKRPKPINPEFSGEGELSKFLNHQPNLLDDEISVLNSNFAVLEPIRNSCLPIIHGPPADASNLGGGNLNWANGSGEVGNEPIGQVTALNSAPASPASSQPETLQAVSEVETRTFRKTMSRKAPKRSPFAGRLPLSDPPRPRQGAKEVKAPINTPAEPLPEFRSDLAISFEKMMDGIRGFRGQVIVQAEFGRILLRRLPKKIVSTKEADHSLEPEHLRTLLPRTLNGPKGPMVFFTNVLTSVPAEMDFLVDMKDRDGQAMWVGKRASWTVMYEFLVTDMKTARPFTIEMDAESFVTQMKIRHGLGGIYVHGIKRHWDFQLAAVGFEVGKNVDQSYRDLSDAINRTLFIPPGLPTPLLLWEMTDALLEKFQIDGARVHRNSRYKSRDGISILKVSEIQDLDVNDRKVPGTNLTVIRAAANKWERKPCVKLDSWYEVSISSTEADDVFQQNEKLELGDEAGWTPQSLTNMGVAQALFLPACEMLKQMDGVGSYNDNGVDVRSELAAPSAVSSRSAPPKPYVFW